MAAFGEGITEALACLQPMLPLTPSLLTDDQLVGAAQAVEGLLRQADALSLAIAREFDCRTDETLGEDSLARKLGARKPWGAIETVTRTSAKDARERVLESRRLAKLPVIETAVEHGVLSRAQAAAIIDPLIPACERADTDFVASACENLVELAKVLPATAVVEAARAWAEILDPDGTKPVEKAAVEKRFFRLGRAKDGLVKFSGALPVEQAAALRTVLDAYVNPRAGSTVRFTPTEDDGATAAADAGADPAHGRDETQPSAGTDAGATADHDGVTASRGDGVLRDRDGKPILVATETQPPTDTRSLDQQRADVLHAVFTAHARSAEVPTMGGAHPTILVTIRKEDLESGRGTARIDGEEQPISAESARRIAESGGYQEVIIGPSGKILNLGDTQRCATPQQRRALAVRDKGCIIPGCTMPARWCEVHHVDPARDGGPTDIDNLTLLCWFHHFTIDTGPYEIRMVDGVPEIRWVFGSHASPWVRAVHNPPPRRDLATAA